MTRKQYRRQFVLKLNQNQADAHESDSADSWQLYWSGRSRVGDNAEQSTE